MTKDEIKGLIGGSEEKNDTLSLHDLEKLKSVANVTLEIDRDTNDYFYKVAIDDLVDREFDYTLLTSNKWDLSLDGKYIVLFL